MVRVKVEVRIIFKSMGGVGGFFQRNLDVLLTLLPPQWSACNEPKTGLLLNE